MEVKKYINSIIMSDKKTKIFFIVCISIIILIVASELIPTNTTNDKQKSETDYTEYTEYLEDKTKDIISNIDGVGNCEVMITLKNGDENIYAKNSTEDTDESSYSKSDEYVFYDSDSGDTPVLLKQNMPIVQGVAVVCDGGDNNAVCEKIINSISSLYDITSIHISVTKKSN